MSSVPTSAAPAPPRPCGRPTPPDVPPGHPALPSLYSNAVVASVVPHLGSNLGRSIPQTANQNSGEQTVPGYEAVTLIQDPVPSLAAQNASVWPPVVSGYVPMATSDDDPPPYAEHPSTEPSSESGGDLPPEDITRPRPHPVRRLPPLDSNGCMISQGRSTAPPKPKAQGNDPEGQRLIAPEGPSQGGEDDTSSTNVPDILLPQREALIRLAKLGTKQDRRRPVTLDPTIQTTV